MSFKIREVKNGKNCKVKQRSSQLQLETLMPTSVLARATKQKKHLCSIKTFSTHKEVKLEVNKRKLLRKILKYLEPKKIKENQHWFINKKVNIRISGYYIILYCIILLKHYDDKLENLLTMDKFLK